MSKLYNIVFICGLVQLNQIFALEVRPNSLPESTTKLATSPEFQVCKRVINLAIESEGDVLGAAIQEDSLLSTALKESEEVYDRIAIILKELTSDQKLSKEIRQKNLNAAQAIIVVVNALDNVIAEGLDRLDAAQSAIIDQTLGSLIAVNGLDCECACPIPKRGIKNIEGTANVVQNCVGEEEDRVRNTLRTLCENLQEVIELGLRQCDNRLVDAEVLVSTELTIGGSLLAECTSIALEKALAHGTDILHDARECWRQNS